MKDFHIKQPRQGERSAPIVGYEYDKVRQRTRTVYLGSVRIDANPNSPARAVRLRPNPELDGQLVELTPERLIQVSEWLEAHGTYRHNQRMEELHQERVRKYQEQKEQERVAGIEAELRLRLESQWRAEFEASMPQQTVDPLVTAVEAVSRAGEFLKTEAARLRSEGVRLTRVRSTHLDTQKCKTALDQLQARANQVRLSAFGSFATDCKEAGLMAAQMRGSKRRGP